VRSEQHLSFQRSALKRLSWRSSVFNHATLERWEL